jgi:NTE family protein
MRLEYETPKKQRALVLGGGGSLGAYQAGVLKVLCQKIMEKDKEKSKQDLLFDVVAGTSIGAMNGAVLVSQFLQTRSWVYAIKKLQEFWTDREKGLASTISQDDFAEFSGWTKWQEASKKSIQGVASAEQARRYYSVKYFFLEGFTKST